MNLAEHTTSSNLEKYAFYWLLALLVLSAGALFIGGKPLVTLISGYSSTVWSLLNLAWIICGASAVYLTYQWVQNKKEIFGGKDSKDTAAFIFLLATGYNLGIVGILGKNIFFQIIMGKVAFFAVGLICLGVAGYLYKQWQLNGESLFGNNSRESGPEIN